MPGFNRVALEGSEVGIGDQGGATPLRVAVSEAGSGDLIAAVSGYKIRVISGHFASAGADTIKLQSGGTTDLTGVFTVATGSQIPLHPSPWGHFETAVSAKLNMVQGGSAQISGWLVYVLVKG